MLQTKTLSPAVIVSQASSYSLNSAQLIPIAQIEPNPFQPRHPLSDDDVFELSRNIQRVGVLEPLLVRESRPPRVCRAAEPDKSRVDWASRPDNPVEPVSNPIASTTIPIESPDAQHYIYQLISGHRRLAAAKQAGLAEVPCIVRNADDGEMLELALIENLQRQNLNPIEEAEGYRSLMKMNGMTQQQVAGKVNKSETVVSQRLALLALPSYIQEAVAAKKLAIHKALEIGRIEDEKRRRSVFDRAHKLNDEELKATVQKALDKRRVGRKRYEKRTPDPLFKDIFKGLPVKRVYKDTVTFVFKEEEELILAMKTAIERWEADASLRGTQ